MTAWSGWRNRSWAVAGFLDWELEKGSGAVRFKQAVRGVFLGGFWKGRSRFGGSIWFNWSMLWIADTVDNCELDGSSSWSGVWEAWVF
jgi:hypothetical protein